MHTRILRIIVFVLFTFGMLVSAGVRAEGNLEAGREKAEACLGCHGIEGYRNAYPSYRVPKVGGQSRTYLVAALKAYRSGDRSHPTMRAQGADLSDDDIEDIAAYFAAKDGDE